MKNVFVIGLGVLIVVAALASKCYYYSYICGAVK
jgi:hypothetical protein